MQLFHFNQLPVFARWLAFGGLFLVGAWLPSGCQRDGKQAHLYAPKSADNEAMVTLPTDMTSYFAYWHIDSAYLAMYIEKGYYRPEQPCVAKVAIAPASTPSSVQTDYIRLQQSTSRLDRLKALCAYLYTTVPTFYIDTVDNYTFDYTISPTNLDQKLTEAKNARFATLCRGYDSFSQALWKRLFAADSAFIQSIDLYVTDPDSFPHTLTVFYFPLKNDYEVVALDATFGYLFPLQGDTALFTLSALRKADANVFLAKNELHYLPDSVLQLKRFLTY